jgi:hypothetical protein
MFTEIIPTYYEKVYTRHVEASVQAWSAHDKSCYLKPSSQLAVPVPRQSYLGPKPDSRCVGESSGEGQLAGFGECNMAKAHRCHGGGEAITPLTRRAFGGVGKGKEGKEK